MFKKSSNVITIGMVGAGRATELHMNAYKNVYGVQLRFKKIMSVTEERLKCAQKIYGFEEITYNLDDLILDNDIDIIDICSPPYTHLDIVTKALLSGKHVICEKPLTGYFGDSVDKEPIGIMVSRKKMYDKVCEELDVKFIRTGSMTVATSEEHLKVLEDLSQRAKENGVETKLLTKEEAHAKEPNLSDNVIAALFCPTAGIVDPFNLVVHAMENAIDNGVKLMLNQEVIGLTKIEDGYRVITKTDTFEGKIIIK